MQTDKKYIIIIKTKNKFMTKGFAGNWLVLQCSILFTLLFLSICVYAQNNTFRVYFLKVQSNNYYLSDLNNFMIARVPSVQNDIT